MVILLTAGARAGDKIHEVDDGLYTTGDLTMVSTWDGSGRLLIRSASHLMGTLDIVAADTNVVLVSFRKQARTDSRSKAFDYIDLISVVLESTPQGMRLELRAPNPAPWNAQTEAGIVQATITVPIGSALEITASYFDLNARGPIRSLSIPASLGKLDISDITEILDVTTSNRKITLNDISGKISATTSNSQLTARDIAATDGQARFRNEGGDIRIDGLRGAVNARNSYGRITIMGFEPGGEGSLIRCASAPVTLDIVQMAEGQLVISNRHEDIDITIPDTLSAFFSLAVDEDGVIEASGFEFRTDLVRPNKMNLLSGGGDVDISGSIRGNGNIFIRGISGE